MLVSPMPSCTKLFFLFFIFFRKEKPGDINMISIAEHYTCMRGKHLPKDVTSIQFQQRGLEAYTK